MYKGIVKFTRKELIHYYYWKIVQSYKRCRKDGAIHVRNAEYLIVEYEYLPVKLKQKKYKVKKTVCI